MIIDCHCHAGKGDGLTGPWNTSAPLGRYLQRAARAGITHVNLFAPFHSDYRRANAEVARIVASRPGYFFGFGFVHAQRDAGRVHSMLQTAMLRYGFRGIKVHRYDAKISREVCEAGRSFNVPILYDVMGEISIVRLLAEEYPDVRFIIPHLGSFSDDWKAQTAFIGDLSRYPNIYTDTAGVRRFDLLEEAVTRAGAHKILWGSDGPWLHPEVELAKVRALRLSPKQEQLILAGNFIRLIRSPRLTSRHSPTPVPSLAAAVPETVGDPWLPPMNGAPHGE